jgi:hypothetical protein
VIVSALLAATPACGDDEPASDGNGNLTDVDNFQYVWDYKPSGMINGYARKFATTAGRETRIAQAAGIAAARITANRYSIPTKGSDLALALAREVFAALPPNSDDSVFVGR